MVNGSSRMRVIIMTDVVYSHFPSHHLFCGGGKPTHSFFALQMSAAEPSHVIISPFPLILEAFILHSTSLFPLSFTCAPLPSVFLSF